MIYHIVAALYKRRVARLVFAAQDFSYLGAEAAEHLVGGIDQHPLFLYALRIGGEGLVT